MPSLVQQSYDASLTNTQNAERTSVSTTSAPSVNDVLPTAAALEACENLNVYDANGNAVRFGSLYGNRGKSASKRVLIIFIRHFFCGLCQQYLRHLSSTLPPSALTSLTPPTSIFIIGCGAPSMIAEYSQTTSCAYPIYADPSRALYDALGMTSTLDMGDHRPLYQAETTAGTVVSGFFGALKGVARGTVFKGGHYGQVGGEVIFEGGECVWIHRMRTTRDHSEVGILRRRLGLDDGAPGNELDAAFDD